MRLNSKLSGRFVNPGAVHRFVPMIWAARGEQKTVTWELLDFAVIMGNVHRGHHSLPETFKLIRPSSVQQDTMPSKNMEGCHHF